MERGKIYRSIALIVVLTLLAQAILIYSRYRSDAVVRTAISQYFSLISLGAGVLAGFLLRREKSEFKQKLIFVFILSIAVSFISIIASLVDEILSQELTLPEYRYLLHFQLLFSFIFLSSMTLASWFFVEVAPVIPSLIKELRSRRAISEPIASSGIKAGIIGYIAFLLSSKLYSFTPYLASTIGISSWSTIIGGAASSTFLWKRQVVGVAEGVHAGLYAMLTMTFLWLSAPFGIPLFALTLIGIPFLVLSLIFGFYSPPLISVFSAPTLIGAAVASSIFQVAHHYKSTKKLYARGLLIPFLFFMLVFGTAGWAYNDVKSAEKAASEPRIYFFTYILEDEPATFIELSDAELLPEYRSFQLDLKSLGQSMDFEEKTKNMPEYASSWSSKRSRSSLEENMTKNLRALIEKKYMEKYGFIPEKPYLRYRKHLYQIDWWDFAPQIEILEIIPEGVPKVSVAKYFGQFDEEKLPKNVPGDAKALIIPEFINTTYGEMREFTGFISAVEEMNKKGTDIKDYAVTKDEALGLYEFLDKKFNETHGRQKPQSTNTWSYFILYMGEKYEITIWREGLE